MRATLSVWPYPFVSPPAARLSAGSASAFLSRDGEAFRNIPKVKPTPQACASARIGRYGLAIFDSDGTLADTLPWMRSVFNDLADEHRFRRVEPHEHEQFRDLHAMALLKALGLPVWKLPRVVSAMRKKMASHITKFAPFPGVPEMLQRLSARGIQLGVVSSNSRANVERILGAPAAALVDHFGCGVSMFGKAARLRAVVRASGVAANETIYIGDEIRDAEAARAAGVAFGAVGWGQHSAETLRAHNPAEFFNDVGEIAIKLCAA
jgi:phosphoglycolate phosphatase